MKILYSVWSRAAAAAAAALLLTGCAHFAAQKTASDNAALPEKSAGHALLTAFIRNDAAAFLKLLPPDVSRDFGENGFRRTRASMTEQLGTPVSFSYALELEHPTFTIRVWKIRYERKSADQKKTLHQETLFRTVSHWKDGRETLLAFNFF